PEAQVARRHPCSPGEILALVLASSRQFSPVNLILSDLVSPELARQRASDRG
ncbi:hypothetical protein A2U01_0098821, partial [Trifolium medium]|nr:hypothetical protein [Trifolium medium]